MSLAKLRIATAALVALGLLGAGLGAGAFAVRTEAAQEAPQGQARPAPAQPASLAKHADSTPIPPKPAADAPDQVGAGVPGTVAGRVLGPNGKPVSNATVVWRQKPSSLPRRASADPIELYPAPVTAKTDALGRFKLDVTIRGRTPFRPSSTWGNLTVLGDGFAPAAAHTYHLNGESAKDIELKLAKTEVPIEGRLIDLEGRPVAGVTVRPVVVFFNAEGDLGPWIKFAAGSGHPPARHQIGVAVPAEELKLAHEAKTDKDGRFKLTGIGDERVVGLRLDGGGIETHYVQVMTRAGEKLTVTNRQVWDEFFAPRDVYPAKFTHAVAAGRTVRGRVTATDSGKPLAGVRVSTGAFIDGEAVPPVRITAITDKDGKYTLTGYPERTPYWLRFEPPAGQPYVAFLARAPRPEGGKPMVVDMKLPRGVFVSGRVTDKASGKPLAAVVHYHPHGGNPHLDGKYPVPAETVCDPKDGSFELLALPGDGVVAAKISDPCRGAYLQGVGAEAVSWFQKATRSFPTPNGEFQAGDYDAFVSVAPKPGGGPMRVDPKLDPGVTASVRFVDPEGVPLAGCSVVSTVHALDVQEIRDLPTDRVTLYAVNPKEPAIGFVTHAKRKLTGTFTIGGGERGELVVKLRPAAAVTARLIDDAGGAPLAARVTGYVHAGEGRRIFALSGQSDKDGKVRVEVVPAGVPVTIEVPHSTGTSIKILPVARKLTFKPGEVRDLGDVRLGLDGPKEP